MVSSNTSTTAANATGKAKVVPVKKQVKVKTEPGLKQSNKPVSNHATKGIGPITPDEKLTKPAMKPIDRQHVVDQPASKLLLPLESTELDDTPTRKRSSSKNDDLTSTNKQKNPKVVPSSSKPVLKLKSSVGGGGGPQPMNESTPETKNKRKQTELVPCFKPPPPFTLIPERLVDNEGLNFDDVFKSIDNLMLRGEYSKVVCGGFDNWMAHGVSLVDKQYRLVEKIVSARMKLSLKFEFVFAQLNRRGSELETRHLQVKEKLQKLQKLGDEIKNSISL